MTTLLRALNYTEYSNPMVRPLLDWAKYASRVIKPLPSDTLIKRFFIAIHAAIPLFVQSIYTTIMVQRYPDTLFVARAENRDYKVLVIGNTRAGKSCFIKACQDMATLFESGSIFSASRDPELKRCTFFDRQVAFLDTQGINDRASPADGVTKRENDEIIARIRKAVHMAFDGFDKVDAVLFVGTLDDHDQLEAIPKLLSIFENEIPKSAKKIAILTQLEGYDGGKSDNFVAAQQYVKTQLAQTDYFGQTTIDKLDAIIPSGVVCKDVHGEETALRYFDFATKATAAAYQSLFACVPDNFATIKQEAQQRLTSELDELLKDVEN